MGSFWQLFSYEPQRWNAIFSGEVPAAKKHLVAGIWDGGEVELPDPEVDPIGYLNGLWETAPPSTAELAERITSNGISYQGLSGEQANVLDSMVVAAFTHEGLEPLLNSSVEQADAGLALREIDELLSRRELARVGGFLGFGGKTSVGYPTSVMQWFLSGRRYGTSEPTGKGARYVILGRDEVKEALRDVEGLLAVHRAWKTPEFEMSIRKELLPALQRVVASNKHFAATYSP